MSKAGRAPQHGVGAVLDPPEAPCRSRRRGLIPAPSTPRALGEIVAHDRDRWPTRRRQARHPGRSNDEEYQRRRYIDSRRVDCRRRRRRSQPALSLPHQAGIRRRGARPHPRSRRSASASTCCRMPCASWRVGLLETAGRMPSRRGRTGSTAGTASHLPGTARPPYRLRLAAAVDPSRRPAPPCWRMVTRARLGDDGGQLGRPGRASSRTRGGAVRIRRRWSQRGKVAVGCDGSIRRSAASCSRRGSAELPGVNMWRGACDGFSLSRRRHRWCRPAG